MHGKTLKIKTNKICLHEKKIKKNKIPQRFSTTILQKYTLNMSIPLKVTLIEMHGKP